jgi:hypothetical protein
LTSRPGIFYIAEMFIAHASLITLSLASTLLTGALLPLLHLLRPARK